MNAVALLAQLDAATIEARLQEIRAERQALLVLLRAARTRERGRPPRVTERESGSER